MKNCKYLILFLWVLLFSQDVCAQTAQPKLSYELRPVTTVRTVADSVKIFFHQGKINLDLNLNGNKASLQRITDVLNRRFSSDDYSLTHVTVIGAASPEGSIRLNRWLSEKRAGVLFDYLRRHTALTDSLMEFHFLGRDWHGLISMVQADENVPFRDETLSLLEILAAESDAGTQTDGDHVARLRRFRNGAPYRYMYRNHFPELRSSRLIIWFDNEETTYIEVPIEDVEEEEIIVPIPEPEPEPEPEIVPLACKPFYMGVKTNMLFDALLIPNIGLEFYLGKNISVTANWHYAWWKTDRHHDYWRTYGGDLEARYWFGKKALEKPLTGHHVGVYGGIVTYDFELGGKGNLAPKWSWFAGLSYGYSLPVGRRFNIDFVLGLGYFEGKYKEYVPEDDCYVWQATKQRRWFGPTKAEITLVWLIGCDNYNRKKGGDEQ